MLNFTPIARAALAGVNRRMLRKADDVEASQRATLASLLGAARTTMVGRRHAFGDITSPQEYASRVPVVSYEDIRADVMKMVGGEKDVLWPGKCARYAQSSGTSGGKSKYIPITDRSLHRCHMAGGTDTVARYLALYPDSRMFAGKGLILGGSYANELDIPRNVHVGDLSASLIDKINPLANLMRVPTKKIALMADWHEKLPLLVDAVKDADVTNLSGVPSWMMTVIEHVMKEKGADELHQVWPSLEVFFHGGIAFGPYRAAYDKLIDPNMMRYMETYNASEGFFALQDDPSQRAMLLLMDTDVYYEFIPLSDVGSDSPRTLSAWEVVPGEVYALVITSSNGLWRYMIGDTVRVASTSPLRITIAGRTQSFINAFGEEVMVCNTDAALAKTCATFSADVADYTAAPVYADNRSRGRHQWLIAFNRPPADLTAFAAALDTALTQENSDYQAKRSGNIFLDPLEIIPVPHEAFNKWLASTGKLGGQRKVPRLKNDRSIADEILRIAQSLNL